MVNGHTIEEVREVVEFVEQLVESKRDVMRRIETRDRSTAINESRTIFRNVINYILQNDGIPIETGDINAVMPIPSSYAIERLTEATVEAMV